jgi:uncharacterized protein
MPYRVLAIDGGGIRGIVPAVLLDRLETLADRPIRDLFDLIVGTSTGGILTLGLTTPDGDGHPRYRAAELLRLYLDDGPRIFRRPAGHRLRTANALLGPRYPADGLEEVLAREFGEVRLRDLLGDVLVPAYETEIREPWFFRSRRARASDGYDFLVRDVARATSAAPVHFSPARITGGDGVSWTLIDGGIYANNPAMCGVVEAMAAHDPADVVTVSLGTGGLTRPLPYDRIRGWGLLGWAGTILDVVFDGISDTTDFQVAQLSRSTDEVVRHLRLQLELAPDHQALDDASPANLRWLHERAVRFADDRTEDLEALLPVLTG